MERNPSTKHLEPHAAAAYVDHRLSGVELEAVEDHLAGCASCRAEVAAVTAAVRARPGTRVMYGGAVAAAAAAILLLVARPQVTPTSSDDAHRAAATAAESGPRLIAPSGAGSPSGVWRWQPVSGADRYELTVFDAEGRVVWDTSTTGAVVEAARPRGIEPGRRYLWRVRARVDWDRWVSSDMKEVVFRDGG